MKRIIFVFASLITVAITFSSFKSKLAAPKLYPELEAYFHSISNKEFLKNHVQALENLKSNIHFSSMDYSDYNIIFYCSENSLRSQASQILLQTLCFSRKFKKVKAFSAGLTSTEVSPALIAYLTKIGYRISKTQKEGRTAYEVRFSDNANPVTLYSKTVADPSLPKKEVAAIIVCDIKEETDCANLKPEYNPLHLAFTKVNDSDGQDKLEALVKEIASEMLYVTAKIRF